MCKICKKHDLGTGELSNEYAKVGEIKDGSLRLELSMLTYSIEDEGRNDNYLLLQYNVNSSVDGLCTVAEKIIPIKYCPFCGEEL